MQKLFDRLHRYEAYVPLYLRLGLGIVFFWFGIDKFITPEIWIGMVPPSITQFLPISPALFNVIQGAAETLVGTMLIIGWKHQLAALMGGIILLPIIGLMLFEGVYDIALRDIGLLSIVISLLVTPETICSIDAWKERTREEKLARR